MATSKAIKFPFQRGSTSFPATVEDDDVVGSQIESLFNTTKRERVMRPLVGVDVYSDIFETITPIMQARLATDVAQQFRDQVPKAVLQAVNVYEQVGGDGQSVVYADVQYSIAGKSQVQTVQVSTGG